MGAGDGDTLSQTHEFGQHFSPRNNRDAASAGLDDLGVVIADGSGLHKDVFVIDVLCQMSYVHIGAQAPEVTDSRRIGDIRTADFVAKVEKHLRDAAHACAADANHVYFFDPVVHDVLVTFSAIKNLDLFMKLSKNSFLDIFSHLTAKLPGFLKLYFSGRRRRKAVFYTAGTGKKPSSGFFSRPAVFLPPPEQKHGPAPRAVHGENFSFLPPFFKPLREIF